ncbi:MAG: carbohydrate ABC transporter permease [Clostridiales bacterium]|jgi:multiple sugar transport system permease protein|nr:carbohydrate ABC transporter permease [Clostridiales bacterium]
MSKFKLFIWLPAIAALFPVLMVFTNSFMSGFEISTRYTHLVRPGNIFFADEIHFVRMTLLPDFVTLSQYSELLFNNPVYIGKLWNSIALALPIVVGQLMISAPAAYAFEMSRFRYKEWVYLVYIIVMLMPLQVSLVPNFVTAQALGLADSRLAIILPGIFNPFGVFIMRQYLRNLPRDYIEAAFIDGAGHLKAFILVIAPLFKTAAAALMLLTFVENWNLVEAPHLFLNAATEPLSVYLASADAEIIFAASFFYLLPCVLIFLYGQEHMIQGIQLSGVK